jgi:AraC family transcriptional regulator of adaptative response/methylated-DNA-[protein]-cysteine methyltransferase
MTKFTQDIIADSIDYIVSNHDKKLSLDSLAQRAGYESTYFQKLFKKYVGISPKRFIQYMSYKTSLDLINQGTSLEDTVVLSGLSSSGRLYDLFIKCHATTPGEAKAKGHGVNVYYDFFPSAFGYFLLGCTSKGVCYLGFTMNQDQSVPITKMKKSIPRASFKLSEKKTKDYADKVVQIWSGKAKSNNRLQLDVYGTNMQIQVWQALLKIPYGHVKSYKEIACELGRPNSSRAVGNAVGSNPVSVLIPCHRVIKSTGVLNNYGWGSARKKMLLGYEMDTA